MVRWWYLGDSVEGTSRDRKIGIQQLGDIELKVVRMSIKVGQEVALAIDHEGFQKMTIMTCLGKMVNHRVRHCVQRAQGVVHVKVEHLK